jgi:predicted nucleic acid-binding protein
MPARAFFDTNVLIYALAQNDRRSSRAETLLSNGGVISTQVLNEFVSVARRKMQMPWNDIRAALDAILVLCPSPLPITLTLHEAALAIAENSGYGICDALVIAAALETKCRILFSEDLQDGQVIAGQLTIRNPFV